MAKKISFGLSSDEVRLAIREIQDYQRSLNRKCEELCRRLTAEGIRIAQVRIGTGGFGKYIRLFSEITPEQAGCRAVFYIEDAQKIVSQWQTLEGAKSAVVSPSLMLEFGAGLPAQNPAGIPGVGTGTFPGGIHGNAPGWWYMDLEGNWHYSSGVSPKMPMYYAGKELRDKVLETAREVFKT